MSWVIGNWKMHGSLAANEALVQALLPLLPATERVQIALCPPAPYLAPLGTLLAGRAVQLGAQDLSPEAQGAYTGDISGRMLREFGTRLVLVGHSERRSLHQETSAQVADKAAAALVAGLTPVICVGETLTQREQAQTLGVVAGQVQSVIDRIGAAALSQVIIAYEPVWAIGTGLTATPEQAQQVHAFLRRLLTEQLPQGAAKVPLLYGGSVKADNAAELFAQADIDGGLIGGASLDAQAFAAICQAAANA